MDTIERIKELMKQRNWSEYRLAKESHMSQSTISNIFHRNTLPSIPTLEIICDAFGISLSQFFAEGPLVDLTPEQSELLQMYSRLNTVQKELVTNLLIELDKK